MAPWSVVPRETARTGGLGEDGEQPQSCAHGPIPIRMPQEFTTAPTPCHTHDHSVASSTIDPITCTTLLRASPCLIRGLVAPCPREPKVGIRGGNDTGRLTTTARTRHVGPEHHPTRHLYDSISVASDAIHTPTAPHDRRGHARHHPPDPMGSAPCRSTMDRPTRTDHAPKAARPRSSACPLRDTPRTFHVERHTSRADKVPSISSERPPRDRQPSDHTIDIRAVPRGTPLGRYWSAVTDG